MTVAEAAREIGLSADAVYDLCKLGLIGHRRVGPNRGRIQVLPSDVAAYLASTRVEQGGPAGTPPPPGPKPRAKAGRLDGKPNRWLK